MKLLIVLAALSIGAWADYYCTTLFGRPTCLWCAHHACFGKKAWYTKEYCQEYCPEPDEPVDTSLGAYLAAAQLKSGIDETVDPCDNFFDFACGGWVKEHPATEESPANSVFTDMQNNLEKNLVTVMELLRKSSYDRSTWKGKAISFYNKCLEAAEDPGLRELNVEDFKFLMGRLGGWPLINFTMQGAVKSSFGGLAGKIQFETSTGTFFDYPRIQRTGLTVFRNDLRKRKPVEVNLFRQVMTKAANATARLVGAEIDNSHLEDYLHRILEFENNLIDLNFNQSRYHYENMKEVGADAKNVGFQDYIEALLTPHVYKTIPSKFNLQLFDFDKDAMAKLDEFLAKSDPKLAQDWLLSFFVMEFWQRVPMMLEDEGIERIKGHPGSEDPKRICVQNLLQAMDLATGRLNAEYIEPATLKLNAATIGQYIIEAYHEQMSKVNWLDEKSKKNVFDKLNNFGISYGWPDWIMDDLALDDWYKGFNMYENETYAGLVFQLTSERNQRQAMFLIHPASKQLQMFPSPLDVINAMYDDYANHLWILAGILQPPYYGNAFPMVLNFGGAGVVMGHEMGHGYDRNGVDYNYNGTHTPLLSPKVHEHFMQKTNCLVNDYNHYCLAKGVCEDGERSITENEADVVGVRMSFEGYRKWLAHQGKAVRLPGLEKYSSDQLFFMNYGRAMCASYTLDEERYRMQMTHSIEPVRVLGATRNIPAFAKAFNCPKKAYMNPSKRCMVWNDDRANQ